jgi:diazepam-binding inhibitor (GABA receptor modulating acyl-CoA-binding protein)
MSLTEDFEKSKEKVLTLNKKPSNDKMLELYALNKQATVGDINIDPPKMFDFVAQAKYNAWKAKAGMSNDEAMNKYIDLVENLFKA